MSLQDCPCCRCDGEPAPTEAGRAAARERKEARLSLRMTPASSPRNQIERELDAMYEGAQADLQRDVAPVGYQRVLPEHLKRERARMLEVRRLMEEQAGDPRSSDAARRAAADAVTALDRDLVALEAQR